MIELEDIYEAYEEACQCTEFRDEERWYNAFSILLDLNEEFCE